MVTSHEDISRVRLVLIFPTAHMLTHQVAKLPLYMNEVAGR